LKTILVPDDDMKLLEKRFGPGVRRMGSWNSDGVFGYSSVPLCAVERAAESLDDPTVSQAVSRLKEAPEWTLPFINLLQSFGLALVEKIVVAYRDCSVGLLVRRAG
jgi:hypothetical protein